MGAELRSLSFRLTRKLRYDLNHIGSFKQPLSWQDWTILATPLISNAAEYCVETSKFISGVVDTTIHRIHKRILIMMKVLVKEGTIFSHPLMFAYMILLAVPMALLMALALQWLELHYIMISFAAGWLMWTLTEYLFNRWLLHWGKSALYLVTVINRHHAKHHADPQNLRYILPHPLITFMTPAVIFLLGILIVDKSSFAITSGFLFGCSLFCLLHVLQHRYSAPSQNFLKNLWQNHFLHHDRYPQKAFGVSTQIWDYLFGTLPRRHLFLNIQPGAPAQRNAALEAKPVNNKRSEEIFLDVSDTILHQDPHWIPCLRQEIKNIFDPSANPYFRHGTARRWILVDASGEVLGRIAAFINFRKMYEENKKVGCVGFFECTNNRRAAFLLFDTAIQWLVERYQIEAVDGPVNFGENDKYWGLLIKGFTPPSYGMNYNPPYYQDLFESYGFSIQYKQLTTRLDLRTPFPERVSKIANRTIENKQYRFVPFRYSERERFIDDFVLIYNQAWASFRNFQPMEVSTIRKSLAEMKPIMDERAIWFVYSGSNPVGFLLAIPDVNEILKYTGGKLNFLGKCKFLFYKNWKGFSCLRVIVMGIVPEFQQRGLESGLIMQAYRRTNRRYKSVQLAWVGDFNDKMIAIHKAMGATEDKQHATFRKLLRDSSR